MREIKMYRDLFKIKELDSNLRFFLSVLISLAEPKLNNKCIIENSNYHQLKKYFIIDEAEILLNDLKKKNVILSYEVKIDSSINFILNKPVSISYFKIPNTVLNNSVLSIEAKILAAYIYNMNKINIYAFRYKYLSNNLAIPEDDVKNLMLDLRNENIVEWRRDIGFVYLIDEELENQNNKEKNYRDVFVLQSQFLQLDLEYIIRQCDTIWYTLDDNMIKNLTNLDIIDKCILSYLYSLTCKNFKFKENHSIKQKIFIEGCMNTLNLSEDEVKNSLIKLHDSGIVLINKSIQFRTDVIFKAADSNSEFVNISKDLLSKVKRMSLQKKIVLSYIKSHHRGMRADNKYLCELFGLSYRVITKMLKEFDRHNLITITYKDGRDYERRKSKNRVIKITEENKKAYEKLIKSGTYLSKMNLDNDEDLNDIDDYDDLDDMEDSLDDNTLDYNNFQDEDLTNEIDLDDTIDAEDLIDDLDDYDDLDDLMNRLNE